MRAAHGALLRQHDGARTAHAFLRDHAHEFRDHVAGTTHDDRVADADVLARDLVHVVQRDVADGYAADEDGHDVRDRRERAGAADVEPDVLHHRRLFLRRKLVRDGPARRARDESEVALPVEAIDLVDDAVDVVRQRIAAGAEARVVLEAAVDAVDDRDLGTGAQAEVAQRGQHFAVPPRQRPAVDRTHAVEEQVERALRRDRGVELAQAARGGVARIGEGLFAALRPRSFSSLERAPRHEDFAAGLEHRRPALDRATGSARSGSRAR